MTLAHKNFQLLKISCDKKMTISIFYSQISLLHRPLLKHENLENCIFRNIRGFLLNQRRDRDSNPGRTCILNGFQDRRIQPLCHLSVQSLKRVICFEILKKTNIIIFYAVHNWKSLTLCSTWLIPVSYEKIGRIFLLQLQKRLKKSGDYAFFNIKDLIHFNF